MSEAPSHPTLRRLLSGGPAAVGLVAALCAGVLDVAFSLWFENPSGLHSGPNLLLTLAASIALAFAAWLAAYILLGLLLRRRPQPLALPVSAALLTAVLLRGALVAVAPEAQLSRAVVPLALVALAVGYLTSPSRQGRPFLAPGFNPGWLRPFATGALLALAAAPLLLLDWSPASTASTSRRPAVPHVILLSIDTLRANALACSGAPEARAPHLDALAGDSLCFARAFSSSSWTLPAMASVMTGVAPPVHGALHLRSRVPDGLPTLAETLRHSGYRTAAFVSSTVLGPQANLTQGFDEFTAWPGPWLGRSLGATLLTARVPRFRPDEAPPPAVADAVADWLRAHHEEPFFLWAHAFDPHAPYGPPARYLRSTPPPGGRPRFEGWDEEAIRAGTWVPTAAERDWIRQLYLAEVRWVDDAIGRLVAELKRLGIYDDALILVVSDHGEEFWEHGGYGHGHTLYDELLHVPLLVKLPRSEKAGRRMTPVSTASLFATVLEACGLPLPTGHPAAGSLLAAPPPALLSQGLNRYEDRRAVRFGRFKYIRWTMSGREELYDLARDPGETADLAASSPVELAESRRLLEGFEAEGRRARRLLRLPEGEAAEIDRKTLERLRSLGYAR